MGFSVVYARIIWMAVKKVLGVGDPKLREVSRPVEKADKRLKKLLQDLEDTLKVQNDPQGVGLAAPQIGVPLRVFVMRNKGKIVPVINPEIVKLSKKTNDPPSPRHGGASEGQAPENPEGGDEEYIMEGCLSLPHYYGPVKRAWSIELKFQTLKQLENRTKSFHGFPAQIIQHEVDHLNGKIFIDRLFAQKRQFFELKKGKWHEVDLP